MRMRRPRLALAVAAAAFVLALAAPCLAPPTLAADRVPLLMDGKKTLYQRVLTRPGAVLKRSPGAGPGAQQPAMTRFYVYGRQMVDGKPWLEVGLASKGAVDGWVDEADTLPWKQQLALAFTNPAGRDRALLFEGRDPLMKIVEDADPAAAVTPLRDAVLAGKSDPRVVSVEPDTYVDIAKQFYLLPILQAEETFSGTGHRMRVLEVASVSAQAAAAGAAAQANAKASSGAAASGGQAAAADKIRLLRNFRAAVVFVIDSTISMGPYIDRTREAVRRIYDRVEAAGLMDRVKFGMVAYRSNVEASPGLEYVSRLFADPVQVTDGADFLKRVAAVKPATVSTARFSEDAYAGVMQALEEVEWPNFGGRYVILVTDAGALDGGDPLSRTKLNAEQVRLEAQHRGVALYALHLMTKEGAANHQEAARQYGMLTKHPLLPQPLYYPVEAGSVDRFGAIVDGLGDALVDQVNAAYRGELTAGAARSADADYTRSAAAKDKQKADPQKADPQKAGPQAADPQQKRLRLDAAMLGQAMRLAYLGSQQGTQVPPLFRAWITDRDLGHPEVATTEVRVLLTKNQLSDMRQVLQSIVEVGQAAQLSPQDFFSRMQSAAAVLGRDPNAINGANATKLADLGLMGEYLDDLPYRSKVLDLDQATWSSWSIAQQQGFLDEVQRKLRLYQIYNEDVDRWIALDGGVVPGEAVYPVPLDALP